MNEEEITSRVGGREIFRLQGVSSEERQDEARDSELIVVCSEIREKFQQSIYWIT